MRISSEMRGRSHLRPWNEVCRWTNPDRMGGKQGLGTITSWEPHFLQREEEGEREIITDLKSVEYVREACVRFILATTL